MKVHQDPKRQTALGMFRYSLDFYDSALAIAKAFPQEKLFGQEAQTAPFTACFMIGHAIELALKAILLHQDKDCHDFLRNKIRHDLIKCLEQVRGRASSSLDFMDKNQKHHVRILNDNYCIKRFEYMMTGGITLPDWPTLCEFTSSLQQRVAQIIPRGEMSMSNAQGLRY